ncbi:hypothetical protein [Streptomyces sp. ME18-1-4]|uniref:hypothetical protein n=1 Tax=Streptomyces sp. ME18-1-4 TaxID=3028685 RepID=UPI0029B14B7D|nr:hypothetical protein [Streptomyces sp. ME18-1-4]MDX3246087.1 hypothetical protein [Streptomyces sp. ME18-1-4]
MNMIKNAKKRIAVGAALTMATAGLVSVGLSTPASAVTCNKTVNASVSGGQASWATSCSGGNMRIAGWVKDTKADGKCAQVKALYSNGTQWSAKACPADTDNPSHIRYFDFNGPGSDVPVYLFTV